MKKVSILTIFPEIFPGSLSYSLAGKALEKGLVNLDVINIRDFAIDKHKTVDDKIFGGGAGMLMRPDVIGNALDFVIDKEKPQSMIYFTPRGKRFDQAAARDLVKKDNILMLCGRYEGVDQRIFQKYHFEEYSIGDYILSGGEMAAMTILDVCMRLIPGVIENDEVNLDESFYIDGNKDLLEYDHYTRPAEWSGLKVPEILLSGNHAEIKKWRMENAIANTKIRRPELLK